MGKRGPAPEPTALRVLRGKRPGNKLEPQPSTLDVAPPAWLPSSAIMIWEGLAPDLIRKGVLTAWDVEAFAAFCDAAARRRRAVTALEQEGEVITVPILDKHQTIIGERTIRNPWEMILNRATIQVAQFGARFGLTPSDRTQLVIGHGHESKDDLLTG